ncbi:hypothetical protein SLE2022_084540 [Rubroshorea leprosula]
MGDLLGSPRVAPLPFSISCPHPRPLRPRSLFLPVTPLKLVVRADRYRFHLPAPGPEPPTHIYIFGASMDGCDHTSTNAPDPIRTLQLSVLGRE